jgi:hypothetical protein
LLIYANSFSSFLPARGIQVDEEQRPMNFSQVFQLAKDGERWYAVNDIFKLVLG